MPSSRETAAVDQLVAAKEAFRPVARLRAALTQLEDSGIGDEAVAPLRDQYDDAEFERLRQARDDAVAEVQKIRAEERGNRDTSVGGDARVEGQ